MRSADVGLVIGTRPEAIKMRSVARALAARGVAPTLIFTGQHPHLDAREFGLERFERVDLGCPGKPDPHEHVRSVTDALLPLLSRPPDLLMVQGDTSSALGAALAAFVAGVPVGHVEAGLRTHDPLLPWPEEEYRIAIDRNAALLFAPTGVAAANLREEDVPGDIHVTGNTGVDATLEIEARLPLPSPRDRGPAQRLLVTCHRRENWRDGLQSIAAAVNELASTSDFRVDFILHPNPFVRGRMERQLAGVSNVTLVEPCGHDELLRRMRDCDLVLSDSGGIQEEAPVLGVPLLVLRDKTERPEAIAAGNALLVGTDQARIVAESRRLLADPAARAAMSRRTFPFGDGRAGEHIAAIVVEWLEQTALTRRLA